MLRELIDHTKGEVMKGIIAIVILLFLPTLLTAQIVGPTFKDVSPDQSDSRYNNDPFREPERITPLSLPDSWPTNIHREDT